jgi:predicted dehydrogenase
MSARPSSASNEPTKPSGASRRDFLRSTTAATASLLAGGGSLARGQDTTPPQQTPPQPQEPPPQPPPPPRPEPLVKIGVIGVGGMGQGHCESIVGLHKAGKENVRIVALADVCKPRLDAVLDFCSREQGENGQPFPVTPYRDYRELLANPEIQGVLIASPEHWHAQMAIDAIRAGKDVYVEKPMTLRLDDAFAIWREQRASDRIVQVGTQYLMTPKYKEAKRLIAEGAIGHPVTSQTSYCRNSQGGEWLYSIDERVVPGEMLDWEKWCGPNGLVPFDTRIYHRWRRYKRFSTGIIGDLLVHQMTPLIWALDCGWPVRVTATGGHYIDKAMENHDQVNLTVQFEKEHTMDVLGSTCNSTGLEVLIRGHKANLFLGGNNCELRPEQPYAEQVEGQSAKFESVPDQDLLRMNWLQCIRTREPNQSPVELATKVMVIVDLATRSLWEGGTWTFSPASLTPART